jgi:hypothetical protein
MIFRKGRCWMGSWSCWSTAIRTGRKCCVEWFHSGPSLLANVSPGTGEREFQPKQLARIRRGVDQARRDPDLACWIDEQREFDTRIGACQRKTLVPPQDLKSSLLAQRRLVRVSFWRQPAWVATAIAAALALLLTVGLLFTGPAPRPVATVARSRGDKTYLLASSHASESDLLHLL